VELLGYAQPCVAHAGDTVEVKVSTTQPGFTAEMVRLGLAAGPAVPQVLDGHFPGRRQELISGSYLIAELGEALGGREHSVQFWFFPTLLAERQCLIAGFGADGGWEVAVGEENRLSFARLSATGDVLGSVSAGPRIQARRWYFAVASWDSGGVVTLVAAARDPRRPGADPGDGVHHDLGGPLPVARVITVGAAVPGGRPRRCFNGKIDTPRVFAAALSSGARQALAADADAARVGGLRHEWRLGPEAALPPHRVRDAGPGRRDGVLVNMPTLGVTGRNWRAATEGFAADPGQYRAAHFHSDDLSDAGWATDLSFEVPAEWRSGVYGIRLRAGEHEDTVPLIVSAAGRGSGPVRGSGRAAAAVLLPTFSYLAYANEHASWERPIKASVGGAGSLVVTERDRYTSEHRLLSLYELHADGSGTCLSSWRRPVLNMRPGYHLPLVRGPHQFSADLELMQWLESRGAGFDVITDDDLHRQGATALDPYRVVLTGSHPEYWSGPMLDGLDSYLADGGRLMYLGGNGFYWVTSAPADDPFVIEVRRGMAGTRVWESPPGEWHQAMTGEHGGIWRHRGRPPQALAGVGFTAQGFDRSLPYRVEPAAVGGRAGFILEGIDPEAPLGGAGSVLGGPAGFEIDRADPALGTPAHAVLVASARSFSNAYQGAVEDVTTADSQQGGTVSELVRSDVVFFETGAGGAVFSVGSIAWCGALRDAGEETPVGRMTWNVLSRFLDETPFKGQEADV
jgi:N,N-dimethylformamidase beta subunit-like, C-terminal/Concanavalin A-like lectin/glucanases superfamily